ncbi:MAG: hypothetical protein AAF212_01655 [Verrucomicrobiota bacterium]
MIPVTPHHYLILTICLCGIVTFSGCGQQSDLAPFEREAYLKNPDNLLGNRYQLNGVIDATLGYQAKIGRLIAVRETPETERIPLFIASGIVENVHVGQRYRFQIQVKEGGLISVSNMEKY